MKNEKKLKSRLQLAITILILLLIGLLVASCRPSTAPDAGGNDSSTEPDSGAIVEAGNAIGKGICSLIEGITDNKTVISICATAEEIAYIIEHVIMAERRNAVFDASVCTKLPGTSVCATREETGRGISLILKNRQALLLKDGGVK